MLILFLIIIISSIDQFIKYIVVSKIKPIGNMALIPNLLDITYTENKGAAFGVLQNQRWLFIVLAIVVMGIFSYLVLYKKIRNNMFAIATALILGGGLGNLIDRLFLGYVVDYLKLSFFSPVCNFADYCITFGTVMLVIYVLFFYEKESVKD